MAFCIECGAKAPDVAKFCPQCGVPLVGTETVSEPAPVVATPEVKTPEVKTPEVKTDVAETDVVEAPELETQEVEEIALETTEAADDVNKDSASEEIEPDRETPTDEAASTSIAPSTSASLAAAANVAEDAPKSKAGLFLGLAVVALLVAGGGAYAMGLFGGGDKDSEIVASAPEEILPTPQAETQAVETESSDADPVLTAYKKAIKTGRISDLGQFANDNPESSLAKDAQDAAFASLQRQSSVLAFTTFTKYFPEADLSEYAGLRTSSDESGIGGDGVNVEFYEAGTPAPSIRTSLAERAGELEPFILQGDTGYAISVIDEMLGLTDLNEDEATYLLNLRARAETSRGLAVPAEVEFIQPDPVAPAVVEAATEEFSLTQTCWDGSVINISANCPALPAPTEPAIAVETAEPVEPVEPIAAEPASLENVPAAEPAAPAIAADAAKPERPYDTAAKPIKRDGAEFPEGAEEGGECIMFFDITRTGSTTNIDSTCTSPDFVEAAEEAVADWTYEPALLNGAPVEQYDLQITIRFNLE